MIYCEDGQEEERGLTCRSTFSFDLLALEAEPDLPTKILGGLGDVFQQDAHHPRAEAAGLHGRALSPGNVNNRNRLFLTMPVNFQLKFDTGDVRGLRAGDPVDDGDRDECVHLFRFIPLDTPNP